MRCYGTIDLAKIREWRDLLFAEALSKYRAGHKWYPTRDEEINYFKPEQEEREIVDPWLYPMQTWLDEPDRRHKNEFTSTEILGGAFKVSLDKIDGNRGMATRLGNLLARIGWKKSRRTTGRREWIYQRPDVRWSLLRIRQEGRTMNRRRSEYVIVYLTDDHIQGSARCTDNVSGKGWITIRFQSVQPRKTEVGREVGRLEAALVADPSNRPTSSNLKRQNSSTRARVCARARDGVF